MTLIAVAVRPTVNAWGGSWALPTWFNVLGLVVAGVPVVAAAGVRVFSGAVLRRWALAAVASYAALLVCFVFAVPDGGIDRIPWLITVTVAPSAAALVAGGPRLAWPTAAVSGAAVVTFRVAFGGLDLDGLVNDLQSGLSGIVLCLFGARMLALGREFDLATEAATSAAERESAEQGRLAARSRAASLVHDEVLATLNLAALERVLPAERLAAQTRRARDLVAVMAEDGADAPDSWELRLLEEARHHDAVLDVRGAGQPSMSRDAQAAVLAAVRQALSNSVHHAAGARRTVDLVRSADSLRVEVVDDGPGFDPAAVADDRLGIRQSIVGRLDRVPGGRAEVVSRPGAGTRVVIEVVDVAAPVLGRGDDALHAGLVALGFAFVGVQVAAATAAAFALDNTWVAQFLLLGGVLCAAELLRRTASPAATPAATPAVAPAGTPAAPGPGVRRTGGVVAIVCVVQAFGAFALPFGFGAMWFTAGFALILAELAFRRRVRVACLATAAATVAFVVAGVVASADRGLILMVIVRPVAIVALAVALRVGIDRVERRIRSLHRAALATAERQSWAIAARSELIARAEDLERTVVPLLDRIATGVPATAADRRDYVRWEGRLRDSLRAGALAEEPLVSAVDAARRRGVDVVLLDDSAGRLPEIAAAPVLAWMAAAVDTARTEVVGRLLTPGRPTVAGLTIDGRHQEFELDTSAGPSADPVRVP